MLTSDLFSVRDLVVVITGGGTGIGLMLARGMVQNGAKVYIVGRRGEVLADAVRQVDQDFGEEARGRMRVVQGDLSTKAGVEGIVRQIKDKEDKVDVLINNAAVQKPWRMSVSDHWDPDQVEKLVWEGVEDDDWNTTHATNVNGVYFMTAALVPLLRKSEIKSVIVISSIAAIANQIPVSTLTYGVSKAAAVHLATMLAGRLAPLAIRVNTILPGTFPTDITATRDDRGEMILKPPAYKVTQRTPLRRAGEAHEILGPVMLLASRAGGYMDNAVISVDGGRNMNAGISDGVRMPEESYA